jgi:putative Mn2+ efflux pump MntP
LIPIPIIEIVLIALSLAMDAFAASVCLGLSVKKLRFTHLLAPGLYFGVFQALMPLGGYFLGITFASKITSFDHWVAFALLAFIGGKMIWESDVFHLQRKDESKSESDKAAANPFRPFNMLALAVATSIDALAVGVTFAFYTTPIGLPVVTIGVITCALSMLGVKIGNVFGVKYKSRAEFIGGAVLILLGIKTVVEHYGIIP